MKKRGKQKFIEVFSNAKLNTQINWLFLLIILAYTAVLGCFMLYTAERYVREYALESSGDMLTSVSGSICNSFDTVSTMSKMIIFSNEVMEYLEQEQADYASGYRAINAMYEVTNHFEKVRSVYVFRKDGKFINISDKSMLVHTELLQDGKWKQEIAAKAGGYSIQINGNGLFERTSGEPLLSLLRVIYDPETQKETGIIAINYTMDYLENIIKELNISDNRIAVMSIQGDFLCGQEDVFLENDVASYLEQHQGQDFHVIQKKHIISGSVISDTPIWLVKSEDISNDLYYSTIPWVMILMIVVLSITCFGAIRFCISVWITKPVEKLVLAMNRVEKGWLHRVSVNVHTKEMRNLKDSYNQMLVRVNRLIGELLEQEKAAQQAKLDVMLEQLNPHFLYNTLETIGYMAWESPREEIYEAVESLGDFYRYFLKKGSDTVPLKTEVEAVKRYLQIQKYRYGEILDDEYEIAVSCEDCLVPKLILQPLVENSLYHGIRPKGEKGTIRICGYEQDGILVLEVYDDGIGISESKISELVHGQSMGFGLRKTLERLKTIYGRERLYEIRSEEGVYCMIRLFVPLRKERQHVSCDDH